MSRKLDLRTGKPVWFAYRAPSIPASGHVGDLKTDVLVVGMGISGAMIAEALTAAGHEVVVLDRRGPMLGSTPATTALVQHEIDQPLTVLTRQIGEQQAVRAWQRSRLAVANLRDRIADLGIDCRATDRPSLFLAGTEMGPAELREEAAARNAAGIRCTYLTAAALAQRFGIDRKGAVLSHGNMALDPRKLTAGLLLLAVQRGARLYSPVEVTKIHSSRDAVTVETGGGATITCKHLVFATGYEMHDIVPAAKHKIISTWAMATKPQPKAIWRDAAFLWEASDPYLYLRATHDGRIICGGEDEDFSDEEMRDSLTATKIAAIRAKLQRLLPDIDTTPDYSWAGSFGVTETGLPIIGAIPRKPRVFAVMGYGGNGITYAQLGSEIVTTMIGGGTDVDADLFAFA
jgi:glycine/D-amino acid oxidase-like deaminating enzyme